MAVENGKKLAEAVVFFNWIIIGGVTLTAMGIFGFNAGRLDAMSSFVMSFKKYVHTTNNTETEAEIAVEMNSEKELLRAETRHMILDGLVNFAWILLELMFNVWLSVAIKLSDYPRLNVWVIFNMLYFFISMWIYFHKAVNGMFWFDACRIIWLLTSVLIVNYFRVNLFISAANNAVGNKTQKPKNCVVHPVKV